MTDQTPSNVIALHPAAEDWPAPVPREQALHRPGWRVRFGSSSPHTEADPIALLIQLLVTFGVAARPPRAPAESKRPAHYPNEFCVLVGASGKGRKGASSWDHVEHLLSTAGDPESSPAAASCPGSPVATIYRTDYLQWSWFPRSGRGSWSLHFG